MKHVLFIVIAMLTGMTFTSQAQEYWEYSWTETQNGGPVWSPDFECGLAQIDTVTIDGTQYLYATGHFALEDKHGDITIPNAGLIFYDGTMWLNLRPVSQSVYRYFSFQGNEYIATIEGIKSWNGNSWQNCWETTGAVYFAFVDTLRNRVVYGEELPAPLSDGTIANHTFLYTYDGTETIEIGKFRGHPTDYDQIGNRGYVTAGPTGDEFDGYTLGIFAIDLDSLVILPTSLEDYPIWAGSIFFQVETNYEGTELYALEVLGGLFKFDGVDTWELITEDADNWFFNSTDEGMIVAGDYLCKFTSFYEDGAFDDDQFKAINGIPKSLGIAKYKNCWYSFRAGGLSEWYRASLYTDASPYEPHEWMNSNIITRMLTVDIPEDTTTEPVSVETLYGDIQKLYPNPATSIVTVEAGQDFIPMLYSITGEKLSVPTVVNKNIYTLDVATLPRGIYILNGTMVVLQ